MSKLLFLGKDNDEHCLKALEFCQAHFSNVAYFLGDWGDEFPKEAEDWTGDYLISFLSRWIVPVEVLNNTITAAINFHPAPPEYPGKYCTNFALYEQVDKYGVTCHHMAERVDSGKIIAVKRFTIGPEETVASLIAKAYDCQLELFFEIMTVLRNDEKLPVPSEQWGQSQFTPKDFDELNQITPDMAKPEIERRIRATSYKNYQPKLSIHGFNFVLEIGE